MAAAYQSTLLLAAEHAVFWCGIAVSGDYCAVFVLLQILARWGRVAERGMAHGVLGRLESIWWRCDDTEFKMRG